MCVCVGGGGVAWIRAGNECVCVWGGGGWLGYEQVTSV